MEIDKWQVQFLCHCLSRIGIVRESRLIIVFLIFDQIRNDLSIRIETSTGDRTHDHRLAAGFPYPRHIQSQTIAVNRWVIPLLIIMTKLNQNIIRIVFHEFVKSQ